MIIEKTETTSQKEQRVSFQNIKNFKEKLLWPKPIIFVFK